MRSIRSPHCPFRRDGDTPEYIALGLRGGAVRRIPSENDGLVKQVTTCVDAANLLVLLANDQLVSTAYGQPNSDMLQLLDDAAHRGTGSLLASTNQSGRFKVLKAKIGLGELKDGSCLTMRGCVASELSLLQHISGRQFVTMFQNTSDAGIRLLAEIIGRTMDNFLP